MTAIRKIVENSTGSVTIELPDELRNRKIEIVILPFEEETKAPVKYDFSDLVGKLKWQGDAIAEQRRLRDEWR